MKVLRPQCPRTSDLWQDHIRIYGGNPLLLLVREESSNRVKMSVLAGKFFLAPRCRHYPHDDESRSHLRWGGGQAQKPVRPQQGLKWRHIACRYYKYRTKSAVSRWPHCQQHTFIGYRLVLESRNNNVLLLLGNSKAVHSRTGLLIRRPRFQATAVRARSTTETIATRTPSLAYQRMSKQTTCMPSHPSTPGSQFSCSSFLPSSSYGSFLRLSKASQPGR